MDREKILTVEISNTGPESYHTATTLAMPASWAEFHDALEKARITDGRVCRCEVLDAKLVICEELCSALQSSCSGDNINLYEVNLLAQKLTMLDEEQTFRLEGLLKMEQTQRRGAIPLSRFINLILNVDGCDLTENVFCDTELGELLYESNMLPEEVERLIESKEFDNDFCNDLLQLFGKRHREERGGVYTTKGYVEAGFEDFQEIYAPGHSPYFMRSGATVVLEVTKGYFHDPSYDSSHKAELHLPAPQEVILNAVETVGAASIKECCFSCIDCRVPAAKPFIDEAIEASGTLSLTASFASLLESKKRLWEQKEWTRYNALLEATKCSNLPDAIQLIQAADDYELFSEITQPWEYAEKVMKEKYPELPSILFQNSQSYHIGMEFMKRDQARFTSYGVIRSKDGSPIPDMTPAAREQMMMVTM